MRFLRRIRLFWHWILGVHLPGTLVQIVESHDHHKNAVERLADTFYRLHAKVPDDAESTQTALQMWPIAYDNTREHISVVRPGTPALVLSSRLNFFDNHRDYTVLIENKIFTVSSVFIKPPEVIP